MLAQQNSKQKSLFFNIKPTVIDKLISKNKSSIQNNLLYSNEDSEESVSDDDSSTSSEGSNLVTPETIVAMAPSRRGNKVGALGSKLSRPQVPLKKGPGRPSINQLTKGRSTLKAMAVKRLLENSKRGRPKKVVKDAQTTEKRKKSVLHTAQSDKVKQSRTILKKESVLTTKDSKATSSKETVQSPILKKNSRFLKELKPVTPIKVKSPQRSTANLLVSPPTVTDSNSSPRKFPSNVLDCWKSTGMVIRGKGRGSFRGRPLRGRIGPRAERYMTRDSQTTGMTRSGKRRKCSDSKLVEGLESDRKRKKVIAQIKKEKNDYLSDEQSSFVTTSEFSFCENDNSLRQSDDEVVISGSLKNKVEDAVNESHNSRDSNSNVFQKRKKPTKAIALSRIRETKNQSNNVKIKADSTNTNMEKPRKTWARGRKKRVDLGRTAAVQPDINIRDSDCSFDSDLTEDSSTPLKSGLKRQRRRGIDGSWVRRSTRSVNKSIDSAETENLVIQDLIDEKDTSLNLDSNSKSSLNIISEIKSEPLEQFDSNINVPENNLNKSIENQSVIKTPTIQSFSSDALVKDVVEKKILTDTDSVVEPDILNETNSCNASNTGENDSLSDFSLALEETPIKKPVTSELKLESELSFKLSFDLPHDNCIEEPKALNELNQIVSNSERLSGKPLQLSLDENICKNPLILDCPAFEENKILPEKEQMNEIITSSVEIKSTNLENNNLTNGSLSKNLVEDLIDPKSNDNISNDIDSITDERIISLIDSFCQSDSQENKELPQNESKNQNTDLSDEIISDINKISNERATDVFNDDIQTLKACEITKPAQDCEDELCSDVKLNELGVENVKESIQDFKSMSLKANEITGNEEMYKDIVKMELVIDSTDKVVESTEESSSSDSNSHLSELLKPPLICETISNTREIPSVDDCDMSNLPAEGSESSNKNEMNNFNSSKKILNTHETEDSLTESGTKPCMEGSIKDIEMPSKELLSALGLQSLHSSAEEEKPKRLTDSYTGTLKAVIKLNRSSDKKSGGRQMIFKQNDILSEDPGGGGDRLEYRICGSQEPLTENVPLTHLGDIPANRKAVQLKVKSHFDLSNSPNIVGVGTPAESGTTDATKEGGKQNLVIPEKSSSFSIHPERLCTDFCCYCLGKFGSLDTPCHLAQLKNSERQSKILANEKHLSVDSCLCDGCFRFIDRKVNCPSSQRARKPTARRGPLAGTMCAVQDCSQAARHSVRRKWLIKLKKSIGKKLVIDMEKNPQLPVPLCSQHYYWVDYFTVCGICKKRLTRNHMYALGPEATELNKALSDDGIPVRLSDNLFLCKLCRYFSNLRLKYQDPASRPSSTGRDFLHQYRKQILQYHDIPVSESEEEGKSVEEEGGSSELSKAKKKKSKTKHFDESESKKKSAEKDDKPNSGVEDRSSDSQMIDYSYLDTLNVHREDSAAPTVDYDDLRDFQGPVGFSNIASLLNPMEGGQGTSYNTDSQNRSRTDKPTRIQVKFGNLNIGKLSNLNIGQDSRQASSTAPAVERPPFLPGERDLNLVGDYEFHGPLNPSSGWERCTYNIQFDRETKKLWQDLQRPYGNQSSFLRHLVMLEKHWRNGTLVFSENPNPKAVKYFTSVQNRVQAYDGAKSSDVGKEKPKQVEESVESSQRATPMKVMSVPPPLMKIAPGSMCWRPANQMKKPPPYTFPVTSTQTSTTQSSSVPVPAPPPYRFHNVQPNQLGYRTVRIPYPPAAGTFQPISSNIKGQQNPRSNSISYQQFKKIRLEPQPPTAVSKVTVVPKIEQKTESHKTSTATSNSSEEFAPLICDVRSLASSSSETDWSDSFRKQQQKLLTQNVAKYFTPILPKIPKSLTVTSFPKSSSLVMKTTSLTIEKAPSHDSKQSVVPPEKPSISVFREPTPGESG